MDQSERTRGSAPLEEAVTLLFCLVDDVYQGINPNGRRYESLKKLSDAEVITLALFQQLRGTESQRSFLRDASRFFSHLFPEVVGLVAPSSFHRRVRKLRRFLEFLRREVVAELVGDPETRIIEVCRSRRILAQRAKATRSPREQPPVEYSILLPNSSTGTASRQLAWIPSSSMPALPK